MIITKPPTYVKQYILIISNTGDEALYFLPSAPTPNLPHRTAPGAGNTGILWQKSFLACAMKWKQTY